MRALRIAAFGLVAAAILFLMLDGISNRMLFPTEAVPPAGPLPPNAELLTLSVAGGETLHGVHVPPSGTVDRPRLLILGFGGNAWNGQDVAEYLHELYPQAHIVAFHYRGYRPSTGSPSPKALAADAPLVHDLAVERLKPERTVAVGFSIGSAVAAGLSKARELDGLVLVTPFDSVRALAQSLFPWVPVGAFLSEDLSAVDDIVRVEAPVAIIAAESDEIVPPERTEALRQHVPNLVFDRTVSGASHNDLYARSDFHGAMDEALTAVLSGR